MPYEWSNCILTFMLNHPENVKSLVGVRNLRKSVFNLTTKLDQQGFGRPHKINKAHIK